MNGAVRLNEERTSAQQDRILEATGRVEQLRSQLSEPGAPRSSIRAEIDAQNRLIAAAQTTLLSLPTASPDAAALSRSADLPDGASNKSYLLVGGLAALLGLALGIGLALIRERLVEPITDRESLEDVLNAPVLAAVPDLTRRRDMREASLVAVGAPGSPGAQAYLAAGVALSYLTRGDSTKVIAIAGPGQGEGKSSTTANLGAVLAQSGSRVIAVSCDLRNPRLHVLLDRSNDVGLTNLLTGRAQLGDILQTTPVDDLFMISSSPEPENPAELLGGHAMAHLLDGLSAGLDFVLLDTSPGLVVADVLFLAPLVDGFIVVSDARTSRADVARLRSQLEGAGGRIIGGVLSRVESKHVDRYLYDSAISGVWTRTRRRIEVGIARPTQQERRTTEAAPEGSPGSAAANEEVSADGRVSTVPPPPRRDEPQATPEERAGDGTGSTAPKPPRKRKTQAAPEERAGDSTVSTAPKSPRKRKTNAPKERAAKATPKERPAAEATPKERPAAEAPPKERPAAPTKRPAAAARPKEPAVEATPKERPAEAKVKERPAEAAPKDRSAAEAKPEVRPAAGVTANERPAAEAKPEDRPAAEARPNERPAEATPKEPAAEATPPEDRPAAEAPPKERPAAPTKRPAAAARPKEPAAEATPKQRSAEAKPEDRPAAEATPKQRSAEAKPKDRPAAEAKPEDRPAAEATPKEPVAAATPKEPVAAATPKEPVAAATPKEPVAAATPKEPVAAATPKEPVAAATPKEPVAAATPKEPVAAATRTDAQLMPSRREPQPRPSRRIAQSLRSIPRTAQLPRQR